MVVGLTNFLLNFTILANSDWYHTVPTDCPEIVPRDKWGARAPKVNPQLLSTPVPYVVIHHSYQPGYCHTSERCAEDMRGMQRFHQDVRKWNDIGYNFAVGGDGLVYEGRGWTSVGAHAPRYNDKSIGIVFIGDYQSAVPTDIMLTVGQELIACGVTKGIIASDYELLGHRQVRETTCPGEAFYQLIQEWPHWVDLTNSTRET